MPFNTISTAQCRRGGEPRFRLLTLVGTAFVALLLVFVVGMLPAASPAQADSVSSAKGWISVEVTANPTTVPLGGGEVTYTYKVTNTRTATPLEEQYENWNYPYRGEWGLDYHEDWVFFSNISSTSCHQKVQTAKSQLKQYHDYRHENYLRVGETAEWVCTRFVTQDTINTFTAKFYDVWGTLDEASASANVSVSGSVDPGGDGDGTKCEGLWFASGISDATTYTPGRLGTIDLDNFNASRSMDLNFQDPALSNQRMNGSAAVAVDPSHPKKIYYVPRSTSPNTDAVVYSGLWVYDSETKTNKQISSPDQTPNTVRLGITNDGVLWSIDEQALLKSFDTKNPGNGTWDNYGYVTLNGTGYTFDAGFGNTSLTSGDLTFDGLGNMWAIASRAETRDPHLFTISREELKSGIENRSGITATYVGKMADNLNFNGIAFGPDGTLYGSARGVKRDEYGDIIQASGGLYAIDKKTGTASVLATYNSTPFEDLGSCSLPQPELKATKTAVPTDGVIANGTITYTIIIKNTGNLEATGVTFNDNLTNRYMSYVPNSATLNGRAWADINGQAPFLGENKALIKSEGAAYLGTITAGDTATITFKVTPVRGQKEVCNSGTINFIGSEAILTDDPSLPNPTDETCVQIYKPKIGIDKKGLDPEIGDVKTLSTPGNNAVRYLYAISTDPNQPKGMAKKNENGELLRDQNGLLYEGSKPEPALDKGNEPLKNVQVKDDKCTSITPLTRTIGEGADQQTFNAGDRNSDNQLDSDEIWLYECVQENLPTDISTENTATATATPVYSYETVSSVTDTDSWIVEGKQATLTLKKAFKEPMYDPQANIDQWNLSATLQSEGGTTPATTLSGKTGDTAITNKVLAPGTYELSEEIAQVYNAKALGYKQESIACVDKAKTPEEKITLQPGSGEHTKKLEVKYGQKIECTFTNSTIPGTLKWEKVDEADPAKHLKGSEWTLKGPSFANEPNGSATIAGAPYETADGKFEVKNLKWGEYTLTELKAPAGYVRDVTDRKKTIAPRIDKESSGSSLTCVCDFGAITNTRIAPPDIPFTGGISRDFYAIVGGVVAFIGCGSALGRRKLSMWKEER